MTVVEFPGAAAEVLPKHGAMVDTLDHVLVGRRGISPVMIGRATALRRLGRLVTGSDGERDDDLPAVALVAGEAGVGKTRLLRELVGSIPPGTTVLVTHAEPGSLGRPLDLIRSMLGDSPADLVDARATAVDAVATRIGEGRSLVIFEDLHWADADSVGVFEQLSAMPLPELTLVATYRPEELTSRLPGGEMVVRLERRRHVHQVHLERLDHHEVAAFLAAVYGRPLGTAVVDALRNRTGGNPFFLEEILVSAGDVDPEALAAQPLPWTLSELVSRQLDGVSSDQRQVVEAAAVLGSRAPFDVLAILTGRSEEQLIADLRSMVQRGLLVEEDDDRFSFRHELVRDAVEDQLLGRQRRRLHERALDVLRQSMSTDLADLARHAAGAGHYDEMVELARDGVGHYLDIGATHQALRLAVAALAESADDIELLTGATRAAWLIGAHGEAWGHAQRLLALTEVDGERRAAAVRLAARIAHERSDLDRMWQLVGELERLVDALPSGEGRAATMAAIAQIDMLHGRSVDAIGWADRAIEEAQRVGAPTVRVQAMIERATAMTDLPERRSDGIAVLVEAVTEAEQIEDWVLLARALHNLSNVTHGAERRGYLDRMRDAGRRAGFDNMVAANYHIRLADMAFCKGDASGAWEHASRVGTHVEGKAADWALALQVRLLLEDDRVDEAAALLEAWARRIQPGPDDKHRLSSQHLALAGRRRDPVAAARRFTEVLEESWFLGCEEDVVVGVVDAIAAGIDPDEVRDTFEAAKSDHLPSDYDVAARALIASARADHDEVIALLEGESEGVTTRLEVPVRATLYVALARALAAHGRTSEARREAATARSMLDDWPGWRRNDADALLQRLDAATAADGELTPREREVAALLAEGLSNSQLARRLYISPRTAAVHVSNILTKLGMTSRTEVATWAVRNGLTAA